MKKQVAERNLNPKIFAGTSEGIKKEGANNNSKDQLLNNSIWWSP
jgi:hypothetical protein